jgi:hypothetical protein
MMTNPMKPEPPKVGPGKKAKGDEGPFPRVAFCGTPADPPPDSYKTQALHTNKVCEKVLRKCKNTKNKSFACPEDFYSKYTSETASEEVGGKPYTTHRCKLSNPTMQKWFDAECKKKKGYICLRRVLIAGGNENDLIDVPCVSDRRSVG